MSGGIKRRNLDNSLIQWIMNEAGLGPGIGEIKYVAPATSGTSQYRTQLETMGVESGDIYTLPSLAYAAMEANRSDVMLLSPGSYTETAKLSLSKARTHLLGTGNPGWRQGGGIFIRTETVGVDATVDIAAAGISMGGFTVSQEGADAANLTPLRISSTHFSAKKLDLWGFLVSDVAGIEAASCLEFAAGASYGWGSTFEDCSIGTTSGSTRTATGATTNGVIYFAVVNQSGSPAAYSEFHRCRILSRAQSTGTTMVKVNSTFGIDRQVVFDDCLFHNFWLNKTNTLTGCFYFDNVTGGSGQIILKGANALVGVDEWVTQDSGHVVASMPITGTGGGIVIEATGVAGA